jgi:hypothetical protein
MNIITALLRRLFAIGVTPIKIGNYEYCVVTTFFLGGLVSRFFFSEQSVQSEQSNNNPASLVLED